MALPEELLTTLVVCLGRLAASRQFGLLRGMGLTPVQIEQVRSLSLAEMNELSGLGVEFMHLRVDGTVFDRALAVLSRRREDQRLAEQLLLAGACHPVMKTLTGMETREFVALRQRLGLSNTGNGRTPKPDAANQRRICEAWVACAGEADVKRRLLEVHAATGLAIRAFWPVVEAWEGQGDLPIEEGDVAFWQELLKSRSSVPPAASSARRSRPTQPFSFMSISAGDHPQ